MTNYRDRLRRLAVNEPHHVGAELGAISNLEPKLLAIAHLASLIAVGASGPTFGEYADAALSAGATCDEIVDVLVSVGPVVGMPRVVSAAGELCQALGVDIDQSDE